MVQLGLPRRSGFAAQRVPWLGDALPAGRTRVRVPAGLQVSRPVYM